jgi:hypothetical protein
MKVETTEPYRLDMNGTWAVGQFITEEEDLHRSIQVKYFAYDNGGEIIYAPVEGKVWFENLDDLHHHLQPTLYNEVFMPIIYFTAKRTSTTMNLVTLTIQERETK